MAGDLFPRQCAYCAETFTERVPYYRHLRKLHEGRIDPDLEENSYRPNEVITKRVIRDLIQRRETPTAHRFFGSAYAASKASKKFFKENPREVVARPLTPAELEQARADEAFSRDARKPQKRTLKQNAEFFRRTNPDGTMRDGNK